MLLVISSRPGASCGHSLYQSIVQQLTSDGGQSASWSPDGSQIVLVVNAEGREDSDIAIMNADGSSPRRITTHVGFDGDPAWSPDGGSVLFSTDRFGGQELALIDVADLVEGRETAQDRGPTRGHSSMENTILGRDDS